MPQHPPLPPDYPVSATAVRPGWDDLPAEIRALVEDRCGSAVVEARSATSGFTAGFASRLLLRDGSRVFVKAAGLTGNAFADHAIDGYREEARKLALLPVDVPAARLRWSADTGDWMVLCLDDVGGRPPSRPWDSTELDGALTCLERAAAALTPAPAGFAWTRFADDFADVSRYWTALGGDEIVGPYAERAADLCAAGLVGGDGSTLTHSDLRDDNVIVADDGRFWVCDWNWPMLGAPWIDTLTLLLSARGDGIDCDRLLAERPLTRDVDPDALDGFLALLTGYWLVAQHDPVPPTSPWIRRHQRWYGTVGWQWLRERRGWT